MLADQQQLHTLEENLKTHSLTYGSRYVDKPIPKYTIPEDGLLPQVAYQVIHDELNLDGNAALNLASFVSTWMDEHAHKLLSETLNKNYIDQDEYPQTTEIQNRCVSMLAELFNSPEGKGAVGTGTIGSSEAIHLAGLALKWNWRKRRQAQGKSQINPTL